MRSNIQPSRWLTHTVSQFVLSILLLHVGDSNTQQQECCSSLNIQSSGPSSRFQSSRLGIYHKVGSLSSRPIYQNENRKEFLFYLTTRSRGLWMIGPNPGSFNGGIANRADQACIENIPRGSWKYADGSGWKKDSELSFECHYDPTECLYSDDSILEGGDLYPARVRFVSGTFECIRLCSSTPGCRYWTVDKLMNETRHVCKLKAWKGSLLPQKGFVSGSLPKACHESVESSSPNVPTSNNGLPSSDDQACVYRNLEFEGGDLRLLQNVTTFSECRSKCSEYIECSLFSHHILRRECRLKSNQVSVKRNLRVSSGASIKTCKQVLSLKKRKQFFGRSKSEFKKYEDNEINGQFRITSEQWNPELENPESNSFQEMSATIKDSLLDMIMEDSDIRDKAKFDITIVGFSPGSVVCNFRINYILKEAYVAIPFIIKPKNVTNALLDNFKFKRGILFQRFVIASGSFKASSPVDHCDAMGCSHKCTYDYALQDYRCICPPGLYLDGDDKNCVEESLTTTTTPSNLPEDDSELPENCLLSPWTRWSRCSATCGPSSRSRARVVILPSKNGGSCDGELREEKPCNLPSCPRTSENDIQDDDDNEDDLNITTEATLISSEEQKAVNNAEAINFNDLKDLAPRITSYKIINGIYYFFLNNTPYYIPNGRIRVLPARNSGPHVVQYTRPDGSKETFELGRNVETPADASLQTSFKAVTPKPISLPDLMQKIDEVSSFYTLNGVVYFIINGIPFYIRDGKTNIVEDEDTGAPQIKYTYPEGRMSFIRLNKFRSNDNNEGREVSNPPVEVSTEEFERLLPDVEFYQVQEGVPYFVINGRPHVISPGRAEIVPSSEEGVYFVRVTLPDGSVSEIQIENDEPLSSSVPTIHSIPQSTPKIVDIQGLEQLIPDVTGFYFVGGIPYFFVKGKPYKVEPGKTEIVYGANGLPKEIKNVLPDGTTYTIDITGRSIPPITTQTTVTPRLEDDSSSASPPNQEDVSVLSQKTPEKITIQELEQLLPNISAYFEVNSEPRFVVNGTPYVVHPGITKVIPGDENSSPTISYTYPNGTTYDIQLGGSSVPSSSQSTPVKTITIDELEDLIPQMSAYYIKDGTPYFVIGGRPYKIEPGTTEVIQDEDSSALTVKHTSPDGTVYEIKLGSSQETDQSTISSTPGPLSFDYNNAKPITIEELEKRISEVTGYFIKDVETYFVLQGEPYVVRPGTTTITKGTKSDSLVIRHTYPNGTVYEISIGKSGEPQQNIPTELFDNQSSPTLDNRPAENIDIQSLKDLVPQITGYYILDGEPYFLVGPKAYRVEGGQTEIVPNEPDSSLTIKHTQPDGTVVEFDLGSKPRIQVSDKKSPSKDPYSVYGEPKSVTFDELKDLLSEFSGYYVKDGITYFIIGNKVYRVQPGSIKVIPDDDKSTISIEYTHPDGTKSVVQLATHSDDKAPVPVELQEFESLIPNLSGYYIKNGVPHFVIKDVPYVIQDGETEIIPKDSSAFTIRYTYPNGTIYDINVGTQSTELPAQEEKPEVISIEELKNLISQVTGYYEQDGITYFIINGRPHRVEPGSTAIKKNDDGALVIQHEFTNGTREEIKLSKEPDQVKTITIEELKDLIPQLTGYFVKNDVPHFIINGLTYKVSPGSTEVIPSEDGQSFVVKHISPEGLVTEINLGKSLKQQESPFDPKDTRELTIDELEKNIQDITGYYIKNGIPYFIINGVPHKISPGKTEIVENKDNPGAPLVIRHEQPDGSIKEIQLGTKTNEAPRKDPTEEITFDEFENQAKKISGYYMKDGEPFFIIDGKTKKISPGKTTIIQDDDNTIIKILHRDPNGTRREIELSTDTLKETEEVTTLSPLEQQDKFVTKSIDKTATKKPITEIQYDDEENFDERVEDISIEELSDQLPNVQKYVIDNGVPYFFFNGVPKRVNSGVTEIIPNKEDGTFVVRNVSPEGEVKEIKYLPKSEVAFTDSTTAKPTEEETTLSSVDLTTLGIDKVDEITFDEFEKEVPNVSQYYIKDGVPHFVINGKPTKIQSGLTEVSPNDEDGSLTISHTYPDGSVKEITLSAQPIQTTQGLSTTVSASETTPLPSDTTIIEGVTTTEPTELFKEDETTVDVISFDGLIKKLPEVTRYYINEGIPYFVIKRKPYKVSNGVTQVRPNDDGTISIVNINPNGVVKEAKISSDQLIEEEVVNIDRPNYISFEDLVKELPRVTRYYVSGGVPYFVINKKPYTVNSGVTQVKPNEDGTISVVNIDDNGSVKEARISSDQLSTENTSSSTDESRPQDTTPSPIEVTTAFKPQTSTNEVTVSVSPKPQETELSTAEDISFGELEKDLPKVTGYVEKDGEPFFIIDGKPKKVSDGKTSVVPNKDDGSITISHVLPDGSVKEITMTAKQVTDEYYTTESTTTSDNFETSTKLSKEDGEKIQEDIVDFEKPEYISFDDLVKELPNVNRYYVRGNVPYFIINNRPYRVDSGVTQVKPNEDGTISIININPDGSVKEAKVSSDQIKQEDIPLSTDSPFARDTTVSSLDVTTTFKSQGTSEPKDETTTSASDKPQETELSTAEDISFGELEKDLPKVTGYVEKDGEPFFIIDGKPKKVSDGKTSVVPNKDDGSITISHVLPDGSVKEITMIAQQVTDEYYTTESTTTSDNFETSTKLSKEDGEKIQEDIVVFEKPEYISFDDLVKELPNVNRYYVQEDIPYFVIDNKPYRVDSGITQVKPNEDGTISIININPDGSVKEAKVSSNQLTEEDIPSTTDRSLSQDTTTSALDVNTTFKTQASSESTDETTTSASKKQQTPELSSAEDISFEELEKDLPKVTGYFEKDGETYFIIDGKPKRVSDGKTSVVPNKEDGSITISHILPDGSVKEITMIAQPVSEDYYTTESPSQKTESTLAIDDLETSTKITKESEETTISGSEKTELFEGKVTTSLSTDIQDDDEETSPESTTSNVPISKPESISFEDLEKKLPMISGYYVKDDVPHFIVDGKPKVVESGVTKIVSDENEGTVTIMHTDPNGTVEEIKLSGKEVVLPSEETTPKPDGVVTTVKSPSDDKTKETETTDESLSLKPQFQETTISPADIGDKQTTISTTEKDTSVEYVPSEETTPLSTGSTGSKTTSTPDYFETTYAPATEGEQKDEFDDIVKDISINDLEKQLSSIEKYYVDEGIPYFVIDGIPRRVDNGETQVVPNLIDGTFVINHVTPEGEIKQYTVDPSEYPQTTTSQFETTTPLNQEEKLDGTTHSDLDTTSSPKDTKIVFPDQTTTNPLEEMEFISFEDLANEVPNISRYFVKDNVPYFIIDGKPKRIEDGKTKVVPDQEDGSINVIHTTPQGEVKSLKVFAEKETGITSTTQAYDASTSAEEFFKDTSEYTTTTERSRNEIEDDDEEKPDSLISDLESVEDISIEQLMDELQNVEKYVIDNGVPYFFFNGVPKRVNSGVTEIIPNKEDGTFVVRNVSPEGEVKEIKYLPKSEVAFTDSTTAKPTEEETTLSSVDLTTLGIDKVDEITFDEFEKEVPNVSQYYIKDGVPHFVINGKPTKIQSGLTEVSPNDEDGSLTISHTYPDGSVKEITLSAQPIQTTQGLSTTVSASETTPLPSDTTIIEGVTTTEPTELFKEDETTVDVISFDDLVKELPNVNRYYVRGNVPYFIINNRPYRVDSGVTQVKPNEDGTISIININPDGSVKEAKVSSDQIKQEDIPLSTDSPFARDTTVSSLDVTTTFKSQGTSEPKDETTTSASDKPQETELSTAEDISFGELEKDLPKVTGYVEKDGEPFFIIDGKPKKVSDGKTSVVPNKDDGSITISHVLPDGSVKEITMTAKQVTDEYYTTESTTASDNSETSTEFINEDGETVQGDVIDFEKPEYISFDDLVKELPNVNRYYVRGNVPYFIINNRPYRVDSGVTQVKPNEDGTISIININPDGSVKEAKVSSDQIKQEDIPLSTDSPFARDTTVSSLDATTTFKSQGTSEPKDETTTSASDKPQETELSTAEDISFGELEKDLPKVTGYVEKDGEPFFIIDGKPKKVSDGKTSVVPNKDDGSITISHVLPDGSVKEITMTAKQVTDEYYTTESTTTSDNFETSTKLSKEDGEKIQEDIVVFEKPEYISFDDLVKELPNVNRYYVQEDIPYFVIDNKPYRVDSGITQVKPNEDGTISIININPDGSVKEAKVSSNQLTEEDIPSTTDRSLSQDTTTSSLDVNTTFKTQASSESTDETTTSASKKQQTPELSSAEDISFEELEKDLPKVTGYFEKDGETYFIIDGKPKRVSDGKTSVVPNKEDGSITISHILPDGSVKEITMIAQPVSEDYYTTESPSQKTESTLAIDDLETSTKITKESEETTISGSEKTELFEGKVTTSLSTDIQDDDEETSPESTTSNVPISKPESISFEDLEKKLPMISGYYVKDDVPHFIVDGKPKVVESGVTKIVSDENEGTVTIMHTDPNGTVEEIKLSGKEVVLPSEETTPKPDGVVTTVKSPSDDKTKETETTDESLSLKPQFQETTISPADIGDKQTTISTTEKDTSVEYVPSEETTPLSTGSTGSKTTSTPDYFETTYAPATEGEQKDEFDDIVKDISINDLEKQLSSIEKYYVDEGIPYFVIDGIPRRVDNGETQVVPNLIDGTFVINHVTPEGEIKQYTVDPSEYPQTTTSQFETTTPLNQEEKLDGTTHSDLDTTSSPKDTKIVFPDQTTTNPLEEMEFISFEDLANEVPNISRYFVKDNVPYFIIDGKPKRIEDGKTKVVPDQEDGSINVIHTTPQGEVKTLKVFAEKETGITSTTQAYDASTSAEEFFKDTSEYTTTTERSRNEIEDDDEEKPDSLISDLESVEDISIEKLMDELQNVEKYVIDNGVPYFFFNGVPKRVNSGVTEIIPNKEDGTFVVRNVSPEGEVKEIKYLPKSEVAFTDSTTAKPTEEETTLSSVDLTTLGIDKVDEITFDEFEKEVPNVSQYYIKDGVPHFVINGKPTKIQSGLTEVSPNDEDGSLTISHTYPDGSVKEITLSAQPIQTTQGLSTTVSASETTPLPSDTTIIEGVTTTEPTELFKEDETTVDVISFDDLVKELPNVNRYYVRGNVPYFIINNRPYRVDSGVTQVKPNEDGTISIININPDGSVKEAKVSSDQIKQEDIPLSTDSPFARDTTVSSLDVTTTFKSQGTSEPKDETTTSASDKPQETELSTAEDISFGELEKDLPKVTGYVEKDGEPFFIIDGKPKKVSDGKTSVVPNKDDGSITISHVLPDGSVKEITMIAQQVTDEYYTTESTTTSDNFETSTKLSKEDGEKIQEDIVVFEKPEYISFDDLVKELPNVNRYYVQEDIPYFVIDNKPYRVDSGITQVKPNEDGTISIININPDGSVKEAKVSSNQLTEEDIPSTTDRSLSQDTTTSSLDVNTTFKTQASSESTDETTTSASKKQQTPELSSAEDISFEELEKDLPKVTGYFEKDGETYFIIDGKPKRVSDGKTSVVPNKEDGSITISHILPDGSVKEITMIAQPVSEDYYTTESPSQKTESTLAIDDLETSTKITKESEETTISGSEKTELFEGKVTTSLSTDIQDDDEETSPESTTSNVPISKPESISFEDLEKKLPMISGYYVKDDVPHFIVDGKPKVVESGVTKIVSDENEGTVTIMHTDPNGTVEEIKLSGKEVVLPSEETTPKPDGVVTTVKSPSDDKTKETETTDESLSLKPQFQETTISPADIGDKQTTISTTEKDTSVEYVPSEETTPLSTGSTGSKTTSTPDYFETTYAPATEGEQKDEFDDIVKDISINDLEKQLSSIEKYYVDEGIPYFVIDGIPRRVDNGETQVVPNLIDGTFVINHVTPEGEIKQYTVDPSEYPQTTTSQFETTTPLNQEEKLDGTTHSDLDTTSSPKDTKIVFPDQTTTNPLEEMEFISFEDLANEVPNISRYFVKDNVPYFIIDGKPKRIEDGKTKVVPDQEDGSINVIHTTPQGEVKSLKIFASGIESHLLTSEKPFVSERTTSAYIDDTTSIPVKDEFLLRTTVSPQTIFEGSSTTSSPKLFDDVSINVLEDNMSNINQYFVDDSGTPYFLINGKPKKLSNGTTTIISDVEDGSIEVIHESPEGETKKVKLFASKIQDEYTLFSTTPSSGIDFTKKENEASLDEFLESTTTEKSENIQEDDYETTTSAYISEKAEQISIEQLMDELQNVEKYVIDNGVPYFFFNGVPKRVNSGVTEIIPNKEDGTFVVRNVSPEGEVKEIKYLPKSEVAFTDSTTAKPTEEETTLSSVDLTTLGIDKVDEITFDEFEKEVPNVSQYYIKDGVPHFVINGKPTKIQSGLTEVSPNDEDGSLTISHTYPDGSVKEITLSAQPIQTTQGLSTTVSASETTPLPSDTTIIEGVTTTEPTELFKEDETTVDVISFDDLVKELPNVNRYYVRGNVPYFIINNRPYRVDSGVTQVKPNEDGTISIININPDGSVKEAKVSSDQIKQEDIPLSTDSPFARDTTVSSLDATTTFKSQGTSEPKDETTTSASDKPQETELSTAEDISFGELEKDLPKVTGYVEKDGEPFFIIDGKPKKVSDGKTSVVPNKDDGSITISHVLPDGSVKEITMTAKQVTDEYYTTESTTTSDNFETSTKLSKEDGEKIQEDIVVFEKPEYISFDDLVKELPNVNRYYVQEDIPYFVIDNKPYRVDSGITQVKPNEDGTISIININPDGSVKEAKVSSNQLTEEDIPSTTDRSLSQDTTTSALDVNTTFKTQASSESTDETTTSASKKQQTPELSSAEDISFEELEKDLPKVTGYFEKDGETYFIIDGKPKRVSDGKTSVVPNKEDGSITISHVLPDGSVKEITMIGISGENEEVTTTSSPLTEIPSATDVSTLSTIPGVILMNMSTPNTVISDITQSEARPITFSDLKARVPDINAYYVVDDTPYFVISGVPYYVNDGVTQLIPGDENSPFMIKFVGVDGTTDEIALENYDIIPGTVETGPNLSISTTEANELTTTSNVYPIAVSIQKLEDIIPDVSSYYVLNDTQYFVVKDQVYYVEDGSTVISEGGDDPDSLVIMHTFPNGTLYEIHLGKDQNSNKPISTTIEELEGILPGITGYYVIDGLPYFTIDDKTYYVDSGKTTLMPGDSNMPFTIHHVFPNGTSYDIALGGFRPKEQVFLRPPTSEVPSSDSTSTDKTISTTETLIHSESSTHTMPAQETTTDSSISFDDDDLDTTALTTEESFGLPTESTPHSDFDSTTTDITNESAESTTQGGVDVLDKTSTNAIDELSTQRPIQKETHESTTDKSNDENTSSSTLIPSTNDEQEATTEKTVLEAEGISIEELENLIPQITAYRVVDDIPYFFIGDKLYNVDVGKTLIMPGNDLAPFMIRHVFENGTKYDLDLGSYKINPEEETATTPNTYSTDSPLIKSEDDTNIQDDDDESTTTEASVIDLISMTTSPKTNTQSPLSEGSRPTETEEYSTTIINFISSTMKPLIGLDTTEKEAFNQETTTAPIEENVFTVLPTGVFTPNDTSAEQHEPSETSTEDVRDKQANDGENVFTVLPVDAATELPKDVNQATDLPKNEDSISTSEAPVTTAPSFKEKNPSPIGGVSLSAESYETTPVPTQEDYSTTHSFTSESPLETKEEEDETSSTVIPIDEEKQTTSPSIDEDEDMSTTPSPSENVFTVLPTDISNVIDDSKIQFDDTEESTDDPKSSTSVPTTGATPSSESVFTVLPSAGLPSGYTPSTIIDLTTLMSTTRSSSLETTSTASPVLDLTTMKTTLLSESEEGVVISKTTTTVSSDITTTTTTTTAAPPSSAQGTESLNCQVTAESCKTTSPTVPLNCKTADSSPITVLINREDINLQEVIDKNLKIIVKEFMLMPMPPMPADSSKR